MGLLDFKNWTPEQRMMRGGILSAIGQGISQLDAGYPVDMQPAFDALNERMRGMQTRKQLDGMMAGLTPEQRSVIAAMPESMAVELLARRAFDPPPAPPQGTDDMREYDLARSQGYTGSFTDYMREIRQAGATTINNNMGASGIDYGNPPNDMAWRRNADGSVMLDDRGVPLAALITGSPADTARVGDITKMAGEAIAASEAGDKTQGMRDTSTDVIITAADRAREAARNGWFDSGLIGNAVASISPESQAAEKRRQVDALKANASAENIAAMRQASPTGAALGAVSDRDIALLADKTGALDAAASDQQFFRALDDYERTLLRVIHGPEAGEQIFQDTRSTPKITEMSDDEYLKSLGLE